MLDQLSTPALVTLHNALAEKTCGSDLVVAPVKRFSDRATATKRVAALLEKTGQEVVAVEAGVPTIRRVGDLPPAEEPARDYKEERVAAQSQVFAAEYGVQAPAKKERKRRGFRFVFPKKDEIKSCREGTKRAQVVELLSRPEGATLEEIMAATGWSQKDAYEGTRLVHFYLGYGMKQDENGRVRLVK